MPADEPSCPPVSASKRALPAALIAVGCCLLLVVTSPSLPMVWDEGEAIDRAAGIQRWFGALIDNPSGELLSQDAIQSHWRYTTQIEGHPALPGMLIAAGSSVAGPWLAPLDAARVGPCLLVAIAVAAMWYRLQAQYSAAAAWMAVAALLTMPRVMAQAHFATWDATLLAAWMLTVCAFGPARQTWSGRIVFGVLLGMTLSAKATGWLAPLPFLVWTLVFRDRRGAAALALGLPLALATFWLLNPPLWHDPVGGMSRFVELTLGRAARPGQNISIQFLGRMHNLDHPLPWYNTLFWTAVTVPLGTLALALTGIGRVMRRRDAFGVLVLLQWLVLIVVRALPGIPPHDGVRLFLPAFGFLAMLAGIGGGWLWNWARGSQRANRSVAVAGLLLLWIAVGLASQWTYWPQLLSYYNLAIGGLRGATALGMEPTYYWDALDAEVLDWLHHHTAEDEKIAFAAAPPKNLALLAAWGQLRRGYRDEEPGTFRWYVVQRRPSAWQPWDKWLIEHATPAYQKRVGSSWSRLSGADVPVLDVYPFEDYAEARRKLATSSR